jgi:4-hydroxythreonine-4-phosphate dehydrogenase
VTRAAPIVLTQGDPSGIGPEITRAAWTRLRETGPAFCVIGDPSLYGDAAAPIDRPAAAADAFAHGLPVVPQLLAEPALPGRPSAANASGVVASIDRAVEAARTGEAACVVTNPVSKSVLHQAGFDLPGHTEHIALRLAAACEALEPGAPVMMLVGGGIRVALATIHTPLRDVPAALSAEGLVRTVRVVDRALRRDFGIAAPRIAIAGLNPHAGESGDIGQEEIEIINPAAARLRSEHGINATDALSADALFAPGERERFDAFVAMYHDQGLIPVKTLDFHGGVNVTLGLPIVRTSPDHGTAFGIAGQGVARPDSLLAAIALGREIAMRRMGRELR